MYSRYLVQDTAGARILRALWEPSTIRQTLAIPGLELFLPRQELPVASFLQLRQLEDHGNPFHKALEMGELYIQILKVAV